MIAGLPPDIAARPLAATRYLNRGEPPWRITVAFQGSRGLRQVRGEDHILGARKGVDVRPSGRPVWGITLVIAGAVTVADLDAESSFSLGVGGWFRFSGQSADRVRLAPGPGFVEMAVSTDLALGELLDNLGVWPEHRHASAEPEPAAIVAGRDLHRALLDPVVEDASLIRRLIHLCEVVRNAPHAGEADSGFRSQACRLLASNPQPGYDVAQAAAELGMSEQVFRKRFAREVGLPPGRWHLRRRMERAATLLATLPVAEVAKRLGYGDPAVFSRQFRQATGIAPRQHRQR